MLGRRFIGVIAPRAFWREIARAGKGEVQRCGAFRLGKALCAMGGPCGEALFQFLTREIERIRRQRAIGTGTLAGGFDACLVVILDVGQALVGRVEGGTFHQQQVMLAQMVKQRDHPVFEQGQPMLHARQTPPIGHGLIERIAGGRCAELLAIAAAEAFDRLVLCLLYTSRCE